MKRQGSEKTLGDLRSRTDAYFDSQLDQIAGERQRLIHELESMHAQYTRMDQLIMEKAASMKVPYVKPALLEINQDLQEEITVDQYNDSVEGLINKLLSVSTYVADLSENFGDHMLGSWLFSGSKPYLVTMQQPDSPAMDIERSRALIDGMLDDVAARFGSS